MKIHVNMILALLMVGHSATIGAAEKDNLPTNAASKVEIRIVDLVIISTNRIMIGTNSMSLATATKLMAAQRETLDVVAVHSLATGGAPVEEKSAAMEKLASIGVPLVLVEKDGEYDWRDRSATDGVRTIKVGTDQLAALRRLWKREKDQPETARSTALETTVEWDTTTGAYELNRVELGLFGRSVWLMHEQRESDKGSGTVGIQLKKEW